MHINEEVLVVLSYNLRRGIGRLGYVEHAVSLIAGSFDAGKGQLPIRRPGHAVVGEALIFGRHSRIIGHGDDLAAVGVGNVDVAVATNVGQAATLRLWWFGILGRCLGLAGNESGEKTKDEGQNHMFKHRGLNSHLSLERNFILIIKIKR